MHRTTSLIAAIVTVIALASPAAAKPGLANETEINNALFPFALADQIRRKCSSIEPRMLRALAYYNNLMSQARAKGYTRAEVQAYVDNQAEQAKMIARGNAYLKQFNASLSDPASLCRVGKAEIAKGSSIGRLLRAK